MSLLDQQLPDYLFQTLGVRAHTAAWDGASRLAAFLTARYRFAIMNLQGSELLLMVDERAVPEPPATVRKHLDQARAKWNGPIVYVRHQVTAYNRKRLIEQRVPFVVPGNQMYLPELGLDLREHFRTPRPSKRTLRPATQAVLVYLLLRRDDDGVTASDLAPALGYSTMTLSRAFDELETLELATSETVDRERMLRLHGPRRLTWELAQPWLIDPVKSRHFVATIPGGLHAGEDALARYTMLAEPRLPVIALAHRTWLSSFQEHPDAELPDRESARCVVEVWKYEPREHVRPGVVDPLSLYLSVNQITNERVAQSRDNLMEQLGW